MQQAPKPDKSGNYKILAVKLVGDKPRPYILTFLSHRGRGKQDEIATPEPVLSGDSSPSWIDSLRSLHGLPW